MINSRLLADLDPIAAEVCMKHVDACGKNGIEILVTSTWRDYEAQDALYAIGRTVKTDQRAITNAKAGQSWHNFKVAWDIVPLVAGKAVWDAKDPLWKTVIECGEAAGAEAGAKWMSFPDLPHFQLRPIVQGLRITLDHAQARFAARGTIFTA